MKKTLGKLILPIILTSITACSFFQSDRVKWKTYNTKQDEIKQEKINEDYKKGKQIITNQENYKRFIKNITKENLFLKEKNKYRNNSEKEI